MAFAAILPYLLQFMQSSQNNTSAQQTAALEKNKPKSFEMIQPSKGITVMPADKSSPAAAQSSGSQIPSSAINMAIGAMGSRAAAAPAKPLATEAAETLSNKNSPRGTGLAAQAASTYGRGYNYNDVLNNMLRRY